MTLADFRFWLVVAFGVGVLGVFALTLAARKARGNLDAVFMSLLFIGTWASGKLIGNAPAPLGAWANIELYPATDAVVALFVWLLFHERHERWKIAILWALLGKEGCDALFWVLGGKALGTVPLGLYMGSQDIGFAVELGCVAWGSGVDGASVLRRLGVQPRRGDPVAVSARRLASQRAAKE